MTIATFADVEAGLRPPIFIQRNFVSNAANANGHLKTSWAGVPASGLYDSTLNGVSLSGFMAGAVAYPNAPAGLANYIARLSLLTAQGGGPTNWMAMLCDRLWHNGGINSTITSLQAIVSPTWPARDEDGSSDGKGVLLAVEHSAAQTISSAPVITVGYTNSAGVAGRAATNSLHPFAAHSASATTLLDLQAGDVGVRSVESITLNPAYTSGTLNLVAYRPILVMPAFAGYGVVDAVTACLPKTPDDAVLFLLGITGGPGADGGLIGLAARLDLTAG